jgi:hypothetical protein
MRKGTWLAVLFAGLLSLGAAWAKSKACNPPVCCPDGAASCCPR